ncbi:MAG TPA: contractile injection system protein, VgrG/Pvc8 family [Burkholderiales bacterium]|nr:contractile injection system protein, VgrG/Pvc8 family [Burkholderiales bacterium]
MMANLARRAEVKIIVQGKNVTKDLAPFLTDFTYNDKTSDQVDDIAITLEDRDLLFESDWLPERGDSIECSIVLYHWDNFTDKPKELRCGKFEVDEVEASGMPEVITIKAVSSLNASIRRELHNKTWEKVSFIKICQEIATNHKMKLQFLVDDFQMDKIDQHDESDLKLIARLCDDNGCKLKIQDDTLVIFDEAEQENQKAACEISKYELMPQYSFRTQAHDIYKEAKVSYFDPHKKKTSKVSVKHTDIKAKQITNEIYGVSATSKKSGKKPAAHYSSYTYLDKATANGGGKTLVIRQKVHSQEEAERLAKSRLRAKNKGEWTAEFGKSGDVRLVAGININIVDFGKFGGLFAVDETTHKVNRSSSYTTSIKAHRVL